MCRQVGRQVQEGGDDVVYFDGTGGLAKEEEEGGLVDDDEIGKANAEEWYILGKAYAGLGHHLQAVRYFTYAQKTLSTSSSSSMMVSEDNVAVAMASSTFELGEVTK